jgi:hypothetical protein
MSAHGGNALSLIKAVLDLLADRRTGVLDVQADGVCTRIYFENGKPLFAEDEAPGETFGRLLVRQGVITNEQFIRVIDEMTLAATGDNQLRFGEVAVAQGVLTHEQVERGLADQVCGIISRSLQRDESQWVFDASSSVAKPPRSFSIEIDPIVLAAMRRLPETSMVDGVVTAHAEELVVLAADPRVLARRFDMKSPELAFLQTIDGSKRARDLLAAARSPDVNGSALLATLILARAVTLVAHPPSDSGHHAAAEKSVPNAAQRPDSRLRDEAVGATAPMVREEAKKRDVPGADASTHAARLAAEQAFQKGMALLRATQTASAAIELRRASALQPESLEYVLYATWAEARSRREIPSESDQHRLLEIAQKAKRRDPMFAFGTYVLGQLSMWAGDDATAKKWFYEALRLDPTSEAGQQVRILARRGTGTVALPSMGELLHRDETTEKAPLSPSEPVQATKAIEPSRGQKPNRWVKGLVPGAALLATAALVIFGATRKSAPSAGRAPSSLPVDSEPKDTSAPPDGRGGGLTASAPVPGKELDGDGRGTVRLPSRASGHRIFVDGRRVEVDGIAPLHLPCGPHVIQIGSRGTPKPIDLRCGGEVQLQ